MNAIDIFIQNYFSLDRSEFLVGIMQFVTSLFDASIYFIIIILCVCFLIYRFRNIRYIILFLATLFVGGLAVYFLKMFFDVSRPSEGLVGFFGQSFPSFHATLATIYFVMIMYIFRHQFNGVWQVVLNIFCVVGISVVAFSRVYLGVHWTSDVLTGIFLGLLISYISIKIFKKQTL
ncbi:MAG: phosphatase PAP2 family protein [Candidatus Zambryskibacteria bacterium]|nr:phosphatase PAP2 family protein [Candidatus Zambryskibacteria bacterium]